MKQQKPWEKYNLPEPKSEASKGELSLIDYEIYSGIEVPKKAFFVRLDGWAFHSLTKDLKLKKPFDKSFATKLIKTVTAFFLPFNPTLAYAFSDEINFLFLKNPTFRRIEKINSVFAGFASSIFAQLIKKNISLAFDCRCIPVGKVNILKYLIWRQAEANRNFNNAYAQYILIKKGFSPRKATKKLAELKTKDLIQLMKENNLDPNKLPLWQRKGIMLYKEAYKKKGYDPIRKKSVIVTRYRVKENWQLPAFNSIKGKTLIENLLKNKNERFLK